MARRAPAAIASVVGVLLALADAGLAVAQRPSASSVVQLHRGSRVRLTPREPDGVWEGRPLVVEATVDTLVGDMLVAIPSDGSRPLVVSLSLLSSVSVFRTTNAITTGGSIVGMLSGAAMFLRWCDRNREACRRDMEYDPDYPADSQPPSRAVLSIIGGAVVGGLLGYAITPRRWQPIVLPLPAGSGYGGGRQGAGGWGLMFGASIETRWDRYFSHRM